MGISYDPGKDRRNVRIRGISFELVRFFDWTAAEVIEDVRRDYSERRFIAIGPIAGRLYVVVFTPRADKAHVISLRKANIRELRNHEQKAGKAKNFPDTD